MQLVAKRKVSQANMFPVVARNGKEALQLYQKLHDQLRLVLMDIHMPQFNGLWATRHIRKYETENRLPRMKIVAMTADASDTISPREYVEAGVDIRVIKPINWDVVLTEQ